MRDYIHIRLRNCSYCLNIVTLTPSSLKYLDLFLFYMSIMSTCMSPHVCAWCLQISEKGVRYPESVVIDGCEPPSECWELNLHPLQEQMLLIDESFFLISNFKRL